MKKKPRAAKPETDSKSTPSSKASTSSTGSHSKWIRTDRPILLPIWVREAIQTLNDAGYVAYVVGGSVRDFLIGVESKDYDIATSARPDAICELFPGAITVGKSFGVIKVPVHGTDRESPVLLEIATFREDLEYRNHRHPSGVRFAGPLEDASRRDFTINALFYDPKTIRILDSVGGGQDLSAGLLRAIGNPEERFREDALRLLRAVRFSTRLGFEIEPATELAIRVCAPLVSKVSAERIRDELSLMWTGPRPANALELLARFGLLSPVLPEVVASPRTLRALRGLAKIPGKRSTVLAWAAVLLESGRDSGGMVEIGRAVTERLRMSGEDASGVIGLLEAQPKFREVFKMREATLQRFVRQEGFEEMLALHRLDAVGTDGNLAFYEFCRSRFEVFRKGSSTLPRLLAGSDLVQLGLSPGPGFAEILRVIEDLALENRLQTKEEALEYVVRNFVK